MAKVTGLELDEYKYHSIKLCELSLEFPLSSLNYSPLEIQVELTTHCNIQCVMCTRPYVIDRPKHLHHNVISKLLPLFSGAVKVIPFGAGEPLLHPQFKEVVEHAKHCRAQVTFNTNGMLLNEGLSKSFVSLGVNLITFSLDAVKEETYKAIRRGSNYSKVMGNLATLVRLKKEHNSKLPMIGLAFVPMINNFREIPELFYLASKLGVRYIFFETLFSPDSSWDNEYKNFYQQHTLSSLPKSELSAYLKDCATLAQKLNLLVYPLDYFSPFYEGEGGPITQEESLLHEENSDQLRKHKTDVETTSRKAIACTMPWTSVFVNVDGLVQTCCYSSRVFGDLNVQEFSEIWNGKEFQSYRNQIINHDYPVECQNCLANGRNRETIPQLTKQQLWSSWKWSTREIISRLYGKLSHPLHR